MRLTVRLQQFEKHVPAIVSQVHKAQPVSKWYICYPKQLMQLRYTWLNNGGDLQEEDLCQVCPDGEDEDPMGCAGCDGCWRWYLVQMRRHASQTGSHTRTVLSFLLVPA